MKFRKKQPEVTRQRRDIPSVSRPKTFSYYRSRTASQPSSRPAAILPRNAPPSGYKSISLRRFLTMLPTLLSLAVAGLVIINGLLLSNNPTVKIVGDPIVRTNEDYQAGVSSVMKRTLTNRTKVTFDATLARQQILELFPEISEVVISVPIIDQKAVITLLVDAPSLQLSSRGEQYILSRSGSVVTKGKRPLSDLPIVEDVSSLSYEVGDKALSNEEVGSIMYVFNEAKAQSLSIASVQIGAAPKDIHVRFGGADTYYVKFSLGNVDIRQQFGAFLALQGRLRDEGIVPSEYIDVRLGERAFIK